MRTSYTARPAAPAPIPDTTLRRVACSTLAIMLLGTPFTLRAAAAAPFASSPPGPEAQRRAQIAGGADRPGPATVAVAARERFLEVERFARLPADQQAKALGPFYRDIAPRTMSSLGIIGALSSYPTNILDRTSFSPPGGNAVDRWAQQLQAAAKDATPEEVADRLQDVMWLQVAAHARTKQTLEAQAKPLAPLVEADLDSPDVAAFQRGANVTRELGLTQYTRKLLDVYIPGGPREKAAFSAILWMHDPAIYDPLRAEVLRDPKTLARHAGLFQHTLYRQKADPEIAKLLSSPDADVRYYAAYALIECQDAALAKPIAALIKEDSKRMQEVALSIAAKLPADAFQSIRADLLGSLKSKDATVKKAAIQAFGEHKDVAVAPALREALTATEHPSGDVDILRALRTLTGTDFSYQLHQWGPAKNADAIKKFDEWTLQHGGTIELSIPQAPPPPATR
jgi:hypothetical protein